MHVLHAHWQPPRSRDDRGGVLLWAEDAAAPPSAPVDLRRKQPLPHPFAAPTPAVQDLLRPWSARADADRRVLLWLPTTRAGPEPSPWLAVDRGAPADDRPRLRLWAVDGVWLDPADALAVLAALPSDPDEAPALRMADDARFWQAAARLALEALARQKVLPGLVETDPGRAWQARWLPVLDDPDTAPRVARLVTAMPAICRAGADAPSAAPAPDAVLDSFLNTAVDAAARRAAEAAGAGAAFDARARDPLVAWLRALHADVPRVDAPPARIQHMHAGYTAWLRNLDVAGDRTCRVALRLQAPDTAEGAAPVWRLYFLLQARDDPSLLVGARDVWAAAGPALAMFGRTFARPAERLLTGLGYVGRLFAPVRKAIESARPEQARLSTDEAYAFMRDVAPVLEQSGFGILVPPWWNRKGARLGVRARVVGRGSEAPARLGLDALVDFEWTVAIGDHTLTPEEFDALVALKQPLVELRGQWVQLDPYQVDAAVRFWRQRETRQALPLAEALRHALAGEGQVEGLPLDDVTVEGWLDDWLGRLRGERALAPIAPPAGLQATLRPYQRHGLAWLDFMRRAGLGGILADDMGLGKTLQLLALVEHLRGAAGGLPGPVLLVCPTSVVTNWAREAARFTPELRVYVHQGVDRAVGAGLAERAAAADLVVTSFALVRRDAAEVATVDWHGVVVDEAQHIKNADSQAARVIRGLPAGFRFALTGTPVENRLAELWSIMQFTTPGYLGSHDGFRRRFAVPVERHGDAAAAGQLRRLVGPFVLRRLKTDPNVIQDLPAKQEVKAYCPLTPEQASLYASVTEAALADVDESTGIARQGRVLSLLTRLKQVCNHPAQLLGQLGGRRAVDPDAEAARSGKLARLAELVDEAVAGGDRALVFTQFAEMGGLLQAFLQARLGRPVLFLHGATPPAARDVMVARFQDDDDGPPVFVLSLKAGGTGINLTRASHVLHFDRWWNPAVEDQATDRAFRIGQTRNVLVHKFVCTGTLEEKIDAMIEDKKALAALVVGQGEQWLTQLSTAELRDLVTLRVEAPSR
ncbi:ATP-dependent helicase [bacterium]|nr:MAG: ATP-dependent helicase [bacterium]